MKNIIIVFLIILLLSCNEYIIKNIKIESPIYELNYEFELYFNEENQLFRFLEIGKKYSDTKKYEYYEDYHFFYSKYWLYPDFPQENFSKSY